MGHPKSFISLQVGKQMACISILLYSMGDIMIYNLIKVTDFLTCNKNLVYQTDNQTGLAVI